MDARFLNGRHSSLEFGARKRQARSEGVFAEEGGERDKAVVIT